MQVQLGKITGDLEVDRDFMLNGKLTGTATVRPGAKFYLNGLVAGDLIVERGSRAELRGKVSGSVVNRGGELDVWGTVEGSLMTEAGETRLDHDAVVRGGVSGPASYVDLPKGKLP